MEAPSKYRVIMFLPPLTPNKCSLEAYPLVQLFYLRRL